MARIIQSGPWPYCPDVIRGLLVLILAFTTTVAGAAEPPVPTEYEIKAAMLYRFAQFLEWPTNYPPANTPIVFGIIGQDPFGASIDKMLLNQKIGERNLVIQRYPSTAAPTNSHLLFIGASVTGETEKILSALNSKSVLTVGEAEDFTRQGGHIRLYIQEKKHRFEVNLAAMERSGLKMHSQVLKLATRITRDGKDVKK